jgi:FAD/FMN-containing dehydrogenase
MKKSACWTLCILLAGSTVAWGQTASTRNTLQTRQQAALMAEAFYEVLLGELNARQSNPGAAFSLLLDAATKINDVRLYQRAVDLALQSRSGDAALQAAFPGVRIVAFGHVGDGNLHYNLSQPVSADNAAFIAQTPAANRIVHDLVAALEGSISAEHGLGQLKRDEILLYKSDTEMALMRAIMAA